MDSIEGLKRNRPIRRKESLNSETQKTIRLLITTLSVMIVVLTVFLLLTTNESAEKGYMLEQQKLKNEQLKDTSDSLNNRITTSTSFSKIDDNQILEEMVPTEKKTYVTPEDNMVK